MAPGMIAVNVMYPNGEGKTFNYDYYMGEHIPMVMRLIGDAMKGASAQKGLGGGEPGSSAPYLCLSTMYFDSIEAFQNAFGPVADQILGDVPNYTNSQPEMQISEVLA